MLQLINEHYVDSVNHISFENDAINAVLQELDPHSSYISSENFKSVEEDMQGSFSGIGIEFNIIDDSIVVVSPIEGTPAFLAGIKPKDIIVSIDSKSIEGLSIDSTVKLIRGKKGTKVELGILRDDELLNVSLIRDRIEINVVDPFSRRGYRFKGIAEISSSGDKFSKIISYYKTSGVKSSIKSIILVKIEKLSEILSPLYDLGYTEEELKTKWKKHYKF